jgi:ribosome-associated heat shock protein Hsp15
MSPSHRDGARLDKWLWAARIFKTRQMAAKAISGGRVEVNGTRTKPSKCTRTGDVLSVRKGPYTYVLIVDRVSDRRGPASEASKLYSETESSVNERLRLARELKTRAAQVLYDAGKPDARTRRLARARKRERY